MGFGSDCTGAGGEGGFEGPATGLDSYESNGSEPLCECESSELESRHWVVEEAISLSIKVSRQVASVSLACGRRLAVKVCNGRQ